VFFYTLCENSTVASPYLVSIKIMEKFLRLNYRDAPDTVLAGYPANPKAGYRISGKGRIPDSWFNNYLYFK
jgi:hypothetical protein